MATNGGRVYGLLVFPGLQECVKQRGQGLRIQLLDFAGPWDAFAATPNARVLAIGKTLEPVRTSNGLSITPTATFAELGKLDVFCVPVRLSTALALICQGGIGIDALLTDAETIAFVREQAARSTWLTSVCTGSLLLGAAGLLEGKKATSHWASADLLSQFGAVPTTGRYVRDGRSPLTASADRAGQLLTGGGIMRAATVWTELTTQTAGIDMGLVLLAAMDGDEVAQASQLMLEYAPSPPFNAGHPDTAPAAIVERARTNMAARRNNRIALIEEAIKQRRT